MFRKILLVILKQFALSIIGLLLWVKSKLLTARHTIVEMSEQPAADDQVTVVESESAGDEAATSGTESNRFIFEDISIGKGVHQAIVTSKNLMSAKRITVESEVTQILGDVPSETLQIMWATSITSRTNSTDAEAGAAALPENRPRKSSRRGK
jgi:hypothetical protein